MSKAAISVIFGARGYGKSTRAREIVRGKKRLIVVDTLGEHGAGRKKIKTPSELVAAVKADSFNLALQFDDAHFGFDWACRVARAVRNATLMVDEVDNYVTAGGAPPPFDWLVRYGRHNGVELVCIARRPPDVWRNLTANADYIYAFYTIEPNDVRYFEKYIGQSSARGLRDLKPYNYLCYNALERGAITYGKTKKA